MENNQKNQLNIEISDEVAEGTYSNLAIISHSRSEFILDFATVLPGLPKPEVGSRILMTPEHTKRLLNALAENISKYEAQFGVIDLNSGKPQGGNTFDLGSFGPLGGNKS